MGDYADLKPFRNMVGTRLSHAPRSPELPTPEQDRRDAWKVDTLQRIGKILAALLGWLGPVLLLVGFLRGIESAFARRVSFALGLAGALLLSCVAYLAINILVQVTSFYNMSPAALAPAYALYLLAMTGIVIDVVQARRRRVAAIIGGTALATAFVLANPFAFDASKRWQHLLGGDQALKGLTFAFTTRSPFGPERLQGAAPIMPELLRNNFYGTAPEGPALTGTMVSSPFVLTKPWLIVPYAGYPVGHGNGLRVRLIDEHDRQVGEEIGCPGPNLEGVSFWAADVRTHVGQRARLVLYDGRTDTEAWVAASPPIPADSPDLAATLIRGLPGRPGRVGLGLPQLAAPAPERCWLNSARRWRV